LLFVYVKENYAYCKALKFAQKKIAVFSGKLILFNIFFFKDFIYIVHIRSSKFVSSRFKIIKKML